MNMNMWKPSKGGEAEVNKRQYKVITPETLEKKGTELVGNSAATSVKYNNTTTRPRYGTGRYRPPPGG